MTQIILARHGQTVFNRGEVFRGRIEIDLDETGRQQADLLADYLAGTKIEAIYCSPRRRAVQTAQAIARRQQMEIQPVADIDDIGFGRWEGKTVSRVREEDNVLFTQWVLTPNLVKLPGGESLNELTVRALAFVHAVVKKHQGTVVLVSHQVVHKCLILALLGLDNSHFWNIIIDTAAITTFAYPQNIFVLKEHNNVSYLKSLENPDI